MTLYEEYEAIIKKRLKTEYGEILDIENLDIISIFELDRNDLDIISIFELDRNDYPISEDYPIVDKGCSLVETEYYIEDKGYYRCFAIEKYTDKFLDIDSNILAIIIKISKLVNRLAQEIKILDLKKTDDKNVKLKNLKIGCENSIVTISERNIDIGDKNKFRECHDCGVTRIGDRTGCDWEICSLCGRQLLSCNCNGESQRIPFGTVREIAARIPYYDCGHIEKYAKKDLLEAIEKGLW